MQGKLNGLQILLVEDDIDSAELLTYIFQVAEASVVVAFSALEATSHLAHFLPDILVSNIVLPEINGYELLHLVKNYEEKRGRQILAVALAASNKDLDPLQAKKTGFCRHFLKPIDPYDLVQELAILMAQNKTK